MNIYFGHNEKKSQIKDQIGMKNWKERTSLANSHQPKNFVQTKVTVRKPNKTEDNRYVFELSEREKIETHITYSGTCWGMVAASCQRTGSFLRSPNCIAWFTSQLWHLVSYQS